MNLQELLNKLDFETLLAVGLVGAVSALLTGKFLRRLLLLPFEFISKKTNTKIDDKLLEEARKDLGVTDATIAEEKEEDVRK